MASGENGFKILSSQGQVPGGFGIDIVLDQETGVQYIIVQTARGVAITPRLDRHGDLNTMPAGELPNAY